MAAPINPAHGDQLPHTKLNSKIALTIRERWEARNKRIEELDELIDKLTEERRQLKAVGTVRQLSLEFGVTKTSIERVIYYHTFYRRDSGAKKIDQ